MAAHRDEHEWTAAMRRGDLEAAWPIKDAELQHRLREGAVSPARSGAARGRCCTRNAIGVGPWMAGSPPGIRRCGSSISNDRVTGTALLKNFIRPCRKRAKNGIRRGSLFMQSNISAHILVLHNYSRFRSFRTLKQLCSADYRASRIQAPMRVSRQFSISTTRRSHWSGFERWRAAPKASGCWCCPGCRSARQAIPRSGRLRS